MNTCTTGATFDNGRTQILWGIPTRRYYILRDGYGLGISNGYTVDRPIIYENKKVAYDHPDALPKYIKDKFQSLAQRGLIQN